MSTKRVSSKIKQKYLFLTQINIDKAIRVADKKNGIEVSRIEAASIIAKEA